MLIHLALDNHSCCRRRALGPVSRDLLDGHDYLAGVRVGVAGRRHRNGYKEAIGTGKELHGCKVVERTREGGL
jgi:hypothetical protein